jgi:hypothetical protein
MLGDPLDDTRWALDYLTLDGVSHLVNGRRIPEIAFLDGRVTGDDGVNLGEGTYRLRGEALSIEIEPVTSLPYPPTRLPEHDVFDYLRAATSATVHGDFLHIRIAGPPGDERGGADELVYRWEVMGSPA